MTPTSNNLYSKTTKKKKRLILFIFRQMEQETKKNTHRIQEP